VSFLFFTLLGTMSCCSCFALLLTLPQLHSLLRPCRHIFNFQGRMSCPLGCSVACEPVHSAHCAVHESTSLKQTISLTCQSPRYIFVLISSVQFELKKFICSVCRCLGRASAAPILGRCFVQKQP
jgi:hypothetical protein